MKRKVERKLLTPERERLILETLGEEGRTIADLSGALRVSEATIRRDLVSLEEQGRVRRVHGGAVRVRFPSTEPLFTQKAGFHAVEKRAISEMALEFVENSETLFLDGGSTILGLARLLGTKRDLTIVTNSLMAAAELMESGHRLIVVGGEFRSLSRTLVGPLTGKILEALHFDKAFMGTIGLTPGGGMSTTDPNEAYTKEVVMKRARKVILLADSSKLGIDSFAASGSVRDIDVIVTDSRISAACRRAFTKLGVKVVTSDA